MKRISWLLFVPLGLAAAAVPTACVEFYEFESVDSLGGEGGMGTVSSTTSTMMTSTGAMGGMGGSGGSGGSGGAPQCTAKDQCPNLECKERDCVNNVCTWTNLPDNTPVDSQLYGDCQDRVCDGMGGIKLVANDVNTDGYDWGPNNPCYMKDCNATMKPVSADGVDCMTAWGKPGKCNTFVCVECPDATNCGGDMCISGRCVVTHCTNATMDDNETGSDCGGPDCASCGAGQMCTTNSDCAGSCTANSNMQCADPTCGDGVKNGDETDEDCGGTCATNDPLKKCADLKKCLYPKDCVSGVCRQGECKEPTCKDQAKNQGEAGVDCGGPCMNSCPSLP